MVDRVAGGRCNKRSGKERRRAEEIRERSAYLDVLCLGACFGSEFRPEYTRIINLLTLTFDTAQDEGTVGVLIAPKAARRQDGRLARSDEGVQTGDGFPVNDFTCTRLEVPLDYANASLGTTAIAFIKFSAQANSESAENLLLNEGRCCVLKERKSKADS